MGFVMVVTSGAKRKSLEVSYGGRSTYGAGSSASSPMPSGAQQILHGSQMAWTERNRKMRERMNKRKIMDPKFWSKNMDPEVWGNLPPNLALEIYKRLPTQSFYRLREVCKDWNLVARERRFTDPIYKPYFVLIHEGEDEFYRYDLYEKTDDQDMDDEEMDDEIFDDLEEYRGHDRYLHGILTFHIKSGGWRWHKLRAIPVDQKLLYKPFSVKGLTFSRSFCRSYQVSDAHSRESYRIPKEPKFSKMSRALGITVDTSVVPHTFKIILGSLDIGTQIYDSVTKSWETRSSLLVPCEEPKFKSCSHSGDCLYIWSQDDKILVYSLEKDEWSALNPPSFQNFDPWLLPPYHANLGSWDGCIFAMTSGMDARFEYSTFWVWELVDQHEQKHWKFVDEMPSDVHRRLMCPDLNGSVQIFSSFCDELVMIYSWVPVKKRAYEFVLYNLAIKKWENVETPNHPVSVHSNIEERWDDEDEWDVEDRCAMSPEPVLIPNMNYYYEGDVIM